MGTQRLQGHWDMLGSVASHLLDSCGFPVLMGSTHCFCSHVPHLTWGQMPRPSSTWVLGKCSQADGRLTSSAGLPSMHLPGLEKRQKALCGVPSAPSFGEPQPGPGSRDT